jgi:uncharacterized membrane protein YgdD (TMEM256/DUF423 family)
MLISPKFMLAAGSALGFLSVALGAFGAHALKPMLLESNRLATYETAVQYQMYHGLALLLTGILALQLPQSDFSLVAVFFLVGVLIFSGSLYLLCATGIKWLGAITPIGGTAFLAGWVLLGWRLWNAKAGG